MILPDIVVLLGDTATGELCVENSDPFVSFQCDIILPGGTEYIDGSAELTDRAVDHSLAASLIPPNTLRLLAYSLSQAEFLGDSGAVATFDIEASGPVGTYPMTLENTILGDSNSQNILTGVVNGEVIILPNPLAVIDDLSVEVVGANVQLNWTAPTWTAGYYRVYRSTQPFFDTNSAESEFSFTGPTSGQVTWTDTNAAGTYEQSFYIVTHSTEP